MCAGERHLGWGAGAGTPERAARRSLAWEARWVLRCVTADRSLQGTPGTLPLGRPRSACGRLGSWRGRAPAPHLGDRLSTAQREGYFWSGDMVCVLPRERKCHKRPARHRGPTPALALPPPILGPDWAVAGFPGASAGPSCLSLGRFAPAAPASAPRPAPPTRCPAGQNPFAPKLQPPLSLCPPPRHSQITTSQGNLTLRSSWCGGWGGATPVPPTGGGQVSWGKLSEEPGGGGAGLVGKAQRGVSGPAERCMAARWATQVPGRAVPSWRLASNVQQLVQGTPRTPQPVSCRPWEPPGSSRPSRAARAGRGGRCSGQSLRGAEARFVTLGPQSGASLLVVFWTLRGAV